MNYQAKLIGEMQERFFKILWENYQPIRSAIDLHKNNLINPPHIHIENAINGDLFSVPGWNSLSENRDNNEENSILSKLLNKSIDEKSTLISLGTYTGLRDIDIIINAPNKNNITNIFTIEFNRVYHAQAIVNFMQANMIVNPFFGKIEDFDFNNEHNKIEESKKVYLAYENIVPNITTISRMANTISKKMNYGDEMILGFNEKIILDNYNKNGIDLVVQNFSDVLGIEKKLEGELNVSTDEHFRLTYLAGMNQNVKINEFNFDFTPHVRNHPTLGKEELPFEIYLAKSSAINRNYFPRLLFELLEQDIEVKDIHLINNKAIMRLVKTDREMSNWYFKNENAPHYGDKKQGSKIDYIIHTGNYPLHYLNFIKKDSTLPVLWNNENKDRLFQATKEYKKGNYTPGISKAIEYSAQNLKLTSPQILSE